MRSVDIIGVGMVGFGKHPEESSIEMGARAVIDALKDASVKPAEVGVGFYANSMGPQLFGELTAGQTMFWKAGVNGVSVFNTENACASGASNFHLAWMAVGSGMYDIAVAVGAEKMLVPGVGLMNGGEFQLEILEGFVAPVDFAMRAVRHMALYGTTREQLAMVSVKNRRHGSMNPMASFREPVTLEAVLNAPMISDPLTRMMCCPNADGAAAVVLCASELSQRYTSRPVRILTSVAAGGRLDNPADIVPWEVDYRACRTAYEMAGIGPDDVDLVECHDAFTINEILHYEALGLCPEGEGGHLVESGATSLGGRIPVNVSGGLISRGHAIAATGAAQLVEGVLQLRGQAGARQVEGAKVYLGELIGGEYLGVTKICTVNVLSI